MKNNVIIAFLLIVIVLLVFILLKSKLKSENDTLPTSHTQIKDNTNNLDYQPGKSLSDKYSNILSDIEAVLKSSLGNQVEEDRNINLSQETDITGDGIPELMVGLGYGGATSDVVSIIKIDNNIPSVVRVKDSEGVVSNFSTLSGGGGGGRYGSSVEMQKDINSIKTTNYFVYGGSDDRCSANVFSWNFVTQIFEYNKIESEKETKELMKICLSIATETGVKYKGK